MLPLERLLARGWATVALYQCWYKAISQKTTRLLANFARILALGIAGPPSVDENDMYLGPLGDCGHLSHQELVIPWGNPIQQSYAYKVGHIS